MQNPFDWSDLGRYKAAGRFLERDLGGVLDRARAILMV